MFDSNFKIIRNFTNKTPTWDNFINHLNYAYGAGGNMIRIFENYYFVVEVFDKDIEKTKHIYRDVYNIINKAHPDGIQERPVFLISLFENIANLGAHIDPVDTIHWNCIGQTLWKIYDENNNAQEYILNAGDLIYIKTGTKHDVTSLTPRAGITFASNPKHQ